MSGNVDMREMNAGGLAVVMLSEGSLGWEDEVEIYEEVCEPDRVD